MEKATNTAGLMVNLLGLFSPLWSITSLTAYIIILLCALIFGLSVFIKWEYKQCTSENVNELKLLAFLKRLHWAIKLCSIALVILCIGTNFSKERLLVNADPDIISALNDTAFQASYFKTFPKLQHSINRNDIMGELTRDLRAKKTWEEHLSAPYVVLPDGTNGYLFRANHVLRYFLEKLWTTLLDGMLIMSILMPVGLLALFVAEKIFIAFHCAASARTGQ
jgi:hypothetical protein